MTKELDSTQDAEIDEIRSALKADFHKLYVKQFTTDFETQRLVRDAEIEVMSLQSLLSLKRKWQLEITESINRESRYTVIRKGA